MVKQMYSLFEYLSGITYLINFFKIKNVQQKYENYFYLKMLSVIIFQHLSSLDFKVS